MAADRKADIDQAVSARMGDADNGERRTSSIRSRAALSPHPVSLAALCLRYAPDRFRFTKPTPLA